MTVLTSEGAEILNVSSNSTLEDSVILTGGLTYATCEMMTPYPMGNMSPQVNSHYSIHVDEELSCTEMYLPANLSDRSCYSVEIPYMSTVGADFGMHFHQINCTLTFPNTCQRVE